MAPAVQIARNAAPSLKFVKAAALGQSPAVSTWVPGGGADQQKTSALVHQMLARIEEGRPGRPTGSFPAESRGPSDCARR